MCGGCTYNQHFDFLARLSFQFWQFCARKCTKRIHKVGLNGYKHATNSKKKRKGKQTGNFEFSRKSHKMLQNIAQGPDRETVTFINSDCAVQWAVCNMQNPPRLVTVHYVF